MSPLDHSIRLRLEAQEAMALHPHAARSALSQGRHLPAAPCPYRTAYQRDRDRILHSKAFRRLKHKTQVFIAPTGDHYRTRLTHSLEVAQIARTVARALRLNEDLTEAIALGHDLGHPPFGHSGEAALNRLADGGFSHTDHSVRIVTVLEPLNLTLETLQGLNEQTKGNKPTLLEAQVVELCDRIAYLHHDAQDGERAGLMQEQDIPAKLRHTLGITYQSRLTCMIGDLISTSAALLESDQPAIALSPAIQQATMALRAWMFQQVYLSPTQRCKDEQVDRLLTGLWTYYTDHSDQLPGGPYLPGLAQQQTLDYLAGMTDRFAMRAFTELLLPTGV
jgi:dGTPase